MIFNQKRLNASKTWLVMRGSKNCSMGSLMSKLILNLWKVVFSNCALHLAKVAILARGDLAGRVVVKTWKNALRIAKNIWMTAENLLLQVVAVVIFPPTLVRVFRSA